MVGSLPIVVSCQATNPTARSTHTSVVERLGDRTGSLGFRAVTTRSIFLSPPVEEGSLRIFGGWGVADRTYPPKCASVAVRQ